MTSSVDHYQIGRGIAYLRRYESTPKVWDETTLFSPGDYVINLSDDYLWTTVSGGTSGTGTGPYGTTGTFTDGGVTWTAVAWTDLGNCSKFTWAAEVETLEHFSSRLGIKTRDKKVVTTQKGKLTLVLDEITEDNLALAVLGVTTGGSTEIFAKSQVDVQVKLEGSNTVGDQFDWFWGAVSIIPGKEVSLIGDGWTEIELTGEVLADGAGDFGRVKAG